MADVQSAAPIVEYARSAYDTVVLDAGGTFGSWNLSLAQLCDELVLVSTTDLASLHAAQRAIAYLDHNRVDTSKVRLVINRHVKDAGLNLDKIAGAFNCEIMQSIPHDADTVRKSLMDGKTIPAGTNIGKQLACLADKLINAKEPQSQKPAAKPGFLSSIFSR
jgi:Flp pilus assembly CpaE family ATPase